MPKGPQGQKRPADVIGNAVHISRIATGEQQETTLAQPAKRNNGLAGAKARLQKQHQRTARRLLKKPLRRGGVDA